MPMASGYGESPKPMVSNDGRWVAWDNAGAGTAGIPVVGRYDDDEDEDSGFDMVVAGDGSASSSEGSDYSDDYVIDDPSPLPTWFQPVPVGGTSSTSAKECDDMHEEDVEEISAFNPGTFSVVDPAISAGAAARALSDRSLHSIGRGSNVVHQAAAGASAAWAAELAASSRESADANSPRRTESFVAKGRPPPVPTVSPASAKVSQAAAAVAPAPAPSPVPAGVSSWQRQPAPTGRLAAERERRARAAETRVRTRRRHHRHHLPLLRPAN